MFKQYLRASLVALLLAAAPAAFAQTPGVGIGTTTPNASAVLDVSSTTKGFLPPRMSTTQRDAINPAATAAGLTIFNTTTGILNTWNGTKWTETVVSVPVPPVATTFAYTGTPQTYVVPAGVTALAVDMAGAAGGPRYVSSTGQGLGGRVRATLAVTPGQVFTIRVGGAGATNVGGYNGGGGANAGDGGGGGASDLRTGGTALTNRVLVAGGGGGGGDASTSAGGAGGGLTGATGGLGSDGGTGGTGGSQTAAGLGGAPDSFGDFAGANGSNDTGGGGNGTSGAGGGGYFGAGSGGNRAGGGGGSSYAGSGTSGVVHTQGYQSGNGYVNITENVSTVTATAPALDASNFVNTPWTKSGSSVFPTVLTSNVGIGTTTPAQKLDVVGSAAVSGSVGIGTTTPAAKLDIQGGADNNGANDPGALAFSYRLGGYRHFVSSRHNAGTGGNALDFYLNNSGSATGSSAPGTGNTRVLTLDNNGGPRVGIGTNAPSQALEVVGNVKITGTGNGLTFPDGTTQTSAAVATATNFIQNQTTQQASSNFNVAGSGTVGTDFVVNGANNNSGTIANGLRFGGSGSGEGLGSKRTATGNLNGLDFYTNSVNRLAITNGGNVGIGTSTPPARLTVQSAADIDMGLRVTNGVADGTANSGNIVLQTLSGGNSGFSFLGINGYNAPGETRFNTTKNRWRLGADQRGIDEFFLDTWNGTTGTNVLRATTAGNVGIGVSPSTKLEVAGVVYSNSGGFKFPDGTTQTTAATGGAAVTASNGLTKTSNDITLGGTLTQPTAISGITSTNALELTGTAAPRITNTTAAASTSTRVLGLRGGYSSVIAGSGAHLSFLEGGDNEVGRIASTQDAGSYLVGLSFSTTNGSAASLAERLRISPAGNVGIGTSSPRGQLDAAGTGDIYLVNSPNVGTTQSLYLPGHIFLAPYSGSDVTYLQARRADNSGTVALRLRTFNNGTLTEAMHLAGNGNVGIGTSTPGQKLEVAGGIKFTGVGNVLTFPDGTTQSTAATGGGGGGDNLGNHTATQALNLGTNALIGNGASISGVGVGITDDGGLNMGQNALGNGVFIGFQSGINNQPNNTTNPNQGTLNQFVGYQAGPNNITGRQNLFQGYQSGFANTSGSNNVFSGLQSGDANTTGSNNVFEGVQSGFNNTGGNQNVFIGLQSGLNNTTGSSNTALGISSGPAAGSGALTNATAIGANAVVSQSNSVVLGNSANVGIGTSAPATKLDVNGNLRLAVRTLATGPPPAATVLLGAADIAYSIYRVTSGTGNYVAGLRLPDAATGLQVPGQQFTIINSAIESTLSIEGTNTDNTAAVVLAEADLPGTHGVMYVWSGSAWVRVQ